MASTTATFLKTRVSKPTLGKWSSGFTACKKYADDNKVPLIAVWSNGDACGKCVNFEKSIMQDDFIDWMETSKCVFWFGCSSDKTEDDKLNGTGYTWARNKKLTTYPFVRVWWQEGDVDSYKSGSSWTGGTAKGGATFVKNLKSVLKKFDPDKVCIGDDCNTCEGDDCSPECDSCDDCSTECKEKIIVAVKSLEDISGKLAQLQSEVNALVEQINK